jgi:RNase H-fold protein (predicted Holliday junction resolvase)
MSKPPFLALDIGHQRTGVALSLTGSLVQPLDRIASGPPHFHALEKAVLALCNTHVIATVIIGSPLSNTLTDTERAEKTRAIANKIKLPESIALVHFNEYATTIDGKTEFPELDRDTAAACVLLRSFLEETVSPPTL